MRRFLFFYEKKAKAARDYPKAAQHYPKAAQDYPKAAQHQGGVFFVNIYQNKLICFFIF